MVGEGQPADPYAPAPTGETPHHAFTRTAGRRRRPIRVRITALLLVPLVSLIALWTFAANITLGDAFDKYDFSTTYENVGLPGLHLVNQLQAERSLSVVALTGRDAQGGRRLDGQRARVNALEASFRRSALSAEARDAAEPETRRRLSAAIEALDTLPRLRARVDAGTVQPLQVINSYSTVLDEVIRVFDGLVAVNDAAILTQGRALIGVGNARAYMLREDSLVTVAMARNGRLTPAEHTAFVQWAAEGRREFEAGLADLNAETRGPLEQLAASDRFARYRAAETAIVNARDGRLPAEAADWQATTQLLAQAWAQKITQASLTLNEMAEPIGQRIIMRLVVAGGFGLLAVVASIVLSLLAARSLSRELRGLQRAALHLAEDRLPSVVARLRRGEEVDVDAEVPPLVGVMGWGRTKEVARVGDAFTKVQRTAIDTAVRESYLREGISRVFLNVAWRSQSLLHRQLRMLDEMERAATDPKALEDLFRLDHLTTRMRRHAEGLVILSGASPGRGWSRPVHVEDVLRGAVSEVEDYTRVEVVVVSGQAAVIGEAVADIVHLLAELIENATVFSPAPTEVLVRGEMGANGFAVDVIDRGIGLDQSELDALNLRLSRPPEFDLAVTDRLGLFVVARLAGRHGIRVALQPSLYGGVSAVVLIPRELIVDADQPDDEDDPRATADDVPAVRPDPGRNGTAGTNGTPHPWPPTSPPIHGAMLNAPIPEPTASAPSEGPPEYDATAGYSAPPSTEDRPSCERYETPPSHETPPSPSYEAPPASFGTQQAGGGRAPLPRRVRGGNLAPQLRDDPAGPVPPEAGLSPETDDTVAAWEARSAEASRDLFAALQAGWLRGRDDEDAADDREARS